MCNTKESQTLFSSFINIKFYHNNQATSINKPTESFLYFAWFLIEQLNKNMTILVSAKYKIKSFSEKSSLQFVIFKLLQKVAEPTGLPINN